MPHLPGDDRPGGHRPARTLPGDADRPGAWGQGGTGRQALCLDRGQETLFKWFETIGLSEEAFRSRVYMAAVCRCFPGKRPKGGDRVPSQAEIDNCRQWMEREFALLRPELLIPVGKLAITQFMTVDKLARIIGRRHHISINGCKSDLIPLPHPSGASTWHRTEPGKSLLQDALELISTHPAWKALQDAD